jgi:hypothetical protein
MFNCGTVPVEQHLPASHHIAAYFVEPHEEGYSGSRIVSPQGEAPGLPRFPATAGRFPATAAALSFMINIFACFPHPQTKTKQAAKRSPCVQSQREWQV